MPMKNAWTDIEDAFYVMYDEVVVVETKSGNKQTLKVLVTSDSTGDPLADDMIGSDRMDITILVRKNDWCFLENISDGGLVTRYVNGNEMKYSVSDVVDDFVFGKIVKAR